MQHADVVIAGAGIVGLSLALELRARGKHVALLQHEQPGLATRAAAGMLAAHDPHNPAALQPLADLAQRLYPAFLDRIRSLSGHAVPIQTQHILEFDPTGQPAQTFVPTLAATAGTFRLRDEQSLNPRDLHAALRAAVQNAGIRIQATTPAVTMVNNAAIQVDCTGAWHPSLTRPSKGQMLRVQLPPGALRLPDGTNAVVRTANIYLVPRLDGSALIGATVEDAGFDLATQDEALDHLRAQGAALLPCVQTAPEVERWSGLRPRTADDLPVLGELAPGHFIANGLFRNGILLAPAVAHVMAQRIAGEPTAVPVEVFHPQRFQR